MNRTRPGFALLRAVTPVTVQACYFFAECALDTDRVKVTKLADWDEFPADAVV
jgi:hypothetical protein